MEDKDMLTIDQLIPSKKKEKLTLETIQSPLELDNHQRRMNLK